MERLITIRGTQMSIVLRFDQALASAGTWRLAHDARGIEARIKLASAPEVLVDVELRHDRTRAQVPSARHVQRLNETDWFVESSKLHDALPRIELVLRDAPAHVSEALKLL